MAREADEQTRKRPPIGGRIVACGSATRQRLAAVLGLDAPHAPYALTAVAWMDNALEMAVDAGGEKPEVLRIESRAAESRGMVLTERLNVFFRGKEVPEGLTRHVAECAARGLADWSMDTIAELVASDPELGKPGLPMPPAPDESKRPRSLLDTWGADDSYADFFAVGEIARGQLDSLDPAKLFRFVQHCEPECLYVNPHSGVPYMSLINYPWDERHRLPFGASLLAGGDGGQDEQAADGLLTTDLDEDDVILGNPSKLREVLEHAISLPDPDHRALFFSNTCIPAVIGEDVRSVVKQAEEKSGRRIFYLTVSARSMTTVFRELLVERRLKGERATPPPRPNAVNLIGFPDTAAVAELQTLLGSAGIEVNERLIPDLVPDVVDRLPTASLNVMYPNRTWQHFYDQLTVESRTPHIAPNAPFGLSGTLGWLREVAGALGSGDDAERAWERHVASWRERWEALRARAAGHRLGIVVRDQESYFLTTPGATWGVPLVAVLEEMGFGLDILMHVSDRKTATENARAIREFFRERDRHTIRAFDSFAFLRHRLEESPSDAFFTYQFFDWRLTEAGKSAFSIQHFEMGAPGAVRTLERLLGLCGTPFYRRYSKYLARTQEGLRIPAGTSRPPEGNP